MKRVTIADVAKTAGLSVATVDRVLNNRRPVRPLTSERVLHAAKELGYHATPLIRERIREALPKVRFGFLLQKQTKEFYQRLAEDLETAVAQNRTVQGTSEIRFVEELSPRLIVREMQALAPAVDALCIVAIDHPHISDEIERLHHQGVATISILSDLSASYRAAHVGVDCRKAGRTAAWTIARTARTPGKVGILIGSHRYLSHEDRESGFRAYFRELGQPFQLLESVVYLDDEGVAHKAMKELLAAHPDLVGCCLIGGGTEGAVQAVRESGRGGDFVFVCNELTRVARQGLIDGYVDMVVATPSRWLADSAVNTMIAVTQDSLEHAARIAVPFEIHISENI